MRTTIRSRALSAITSITVLIATFLAAPVRADTKLGLIDLKKVFDGYWKTKQADAQLKERAADLDKSRKSLVEDFQKASEEYKRLIESANDQAISSEERDKRKGSAEKKLVEVKDIEQTINLFDRNSRENLGTQQRRMRDKILEEIKEVTNTKAKSGGYTVIFDTAAETPNQTPVLLFNNGQNDITEEVLTQLNSSAPAGTPSISDTKDKTTEEKKEEKK